jgi:hypothetical protein
MRTPRRPAKREGVADPVHATAAPQAAKPSAAPPMPDSPLPAVSADPSDADAPLPAGLPANVAATLAKAGEAAATRLLSLLTGPRFDRFRPSEQRALIELALTRAYGLPVRREVSVSLTSSDTDAVAASLAHLAGRPLPEYRQSATESHAGGRNDPSEDDDSRDPVSPVSEPLRRSRRHVHLRTIGE